MKSIILLAFSLLVLLPSVGSAQAQNTVRWMSFEEAMKQNAKVPKKVFIDLYTDWCGWCKKMDASTFRDLEVVSYLNEKYYSVKFNAESRDTIRFGGSIFVYRAENRTHELAIALMQGKLSGYPSTVYMNESNEILNSQAGYLTKETIIPILKFFGENKHLSMTFEEFQNALKNPK
jgi:thioredoxin-related protein